MNDTSDHRAAVTWWRRLANTDPLSAPVALGLMRALTASGDRGAALQHYRVYEMLLRQELDVTPDATLSSFAEQLRTQPAAPPPSAVPSGATPVGHVPPTATPTGAVPSADPPPTAAQSSRAPVVHTPPTAAQDPNQPFTTIPKTPAVQRPVTNSGETRTAKFGRGYTDEYARPRPIGERSLPGLSDGTGTSGETAV